ncbi:MAG: PEP-CTERM sorting domain-containing protein [Pirellulales bacterium]
MKRHLLVLSMLLLVPNASAETITQDVRFSYSRANVGSLVLESGPASAFPHPYYKVISPLTSQLSVSHHSRVNVSYDPELAAPGTASIQMSLSSVSASFREVFGGSATAGLGINPFNRSQPLVSLGIGMSVDNQASGLGIIGSTLSGNDTGTLDAFIPGLGIPFVLEATVLPSMTADTTVRFNNLGGSVIYRNRDTGLSGSQSVAFTSGGQIRNLELNLAEPGTYDVSFLPQLAGSGQSSRSFGVSFNVEVFGSGIIDPPPTIALSAPSITGGALPFQINAADRNAMQDWFTIHVVPEPSTWAMCLSAVVSLGACLARNRRRLC